MWERVEAQARYTPHRCTRRHRACREGSWEGGGSLVAAGDSVVPWGGDAACHDGNFTMVWCNNLLYFRRRGVIFTARKKRITILAPQWHGKVAPLPLWSQNREPVVLMLHVQCQGGGDIGRCWMRRRWKKLLRRGEASATRRGVISGPREPILEKNTWNFFWYVR